VGFKGDNFLNLVAVTNTDLSLIVVQEYLKHLEMSQGRDRQQEKFSSRPIDVDILTFGDSDGSEIGITLPRPEITRNAFVLLPLAALLPEQIHPPSKRSYAELWADYDKSSQRLWPVSLD
jgi:2-amino-4-hydroxy-6-hydroxymethyldihydropteridine diphosphokinase